jgi:hypothetical protein
LQVIPPSPPARLHFLMKLRFQINSQFVRQPMNQRRGSTRVVLLIWIASIAAAAVFIIRSAAVPRPVNFLVAGAAPVRARFQNGSWYWLERPGRDKQKLVRAGAGSQQTIDTADEISGYDVSTSTTIWAGRNGKQWFVKTQSGSAQSIEIWTGSEPVVSVQLSQEFAFWLLSINAPVKVSLPIPPLDRKLSLMKAQIMSGTPALVARLMEQDGEIFGVRDEQVFITAWRGGPPGGTAFYRVDRDGQIKRFAGEIGRSTAIITRDGTLYWTGHTRESYEEGAIGSIVRMKRDGKPELISDWYPADGQLYETSRGLYYVDGNVRRQVWPVADIGQMPHLLSYDILFSAVAVSDSDVLFQPIKKDLKAVQLSRSPLP